MNIQNVEAFLFVHHFGSVNKAAEALFLSQPTVSSRIRTLERDLDVALFDRVGRSLVMTEEGKAFLPYAEAIVQAFKSGRKRIQEKASIDHIVIGCTGLISNYVLPYILPHFKEQYPNVRVSVHTGTTEEIETKVLHREVDIGFVRMSNHHSLEKLDVFETPIRLFVKTTHAFAKLDEVTLPQLAQEAIVFYECGSLDWTMIKNIFQHAPALPNMAYEVDSMETAKALILQGAGIGFLPEICVKNEISKHVVKKIAFPVVKNESLKTQMVHYVGEKSTYFDVLATMMREIDRVLL